MMNAALTALAEALIADENASDKTRAAAEQLLAAARDEAISYERALEAFPPSR